jgi:hypothetical protein
MKEGATHEIPNEANFSLRPLCPEPVPDLIRDGMKNETNPKPVASTCPYRRGKCNEDGCETKPNSGYLNHKKTKRTQTYPVNPTMKNTKQTQIIAFSIQNPALSKKQTQIKPVLLSYVLWQKCKTKPNVII